MEFEWDTEKAWRNRVEHGVSFEDAISIFAGRLLEEVDDRDDYGELRLQAIGVAGGTVLQVVYTPRGRRYRIISARKATKNERTKYAR